MKVNITNKELKYFDKVILEGMNEESNYHDFIGAKSTPKSIFGEIIVVKTGLGYKELITGIIIPRLYTFYPNPEELSPYYAGTKDPYHAVYASRPGVTTEEIDKYIEENNNEVFKNRLISFINDAKAVKKQQKRSKTLTRRISM